MGTQTSAVACDFTMNLKLHLAHAMGSSAAVSASTWRAAWSSVCVVTLVRKPSGDSCASAGPVQGLVGKSVAGSSRPASSGTLRVQSQRVNQQATGIKPPPRQGPAVRATSLEPVTLASGRHGGKSGTAERTLCVALIREAQLQKDMVLLTWHERAEICSTAQGIVTARKIPYIGSTRAPDLGSCNADGAFQAPAAVRTNGSVRRTSAMQASCNVSVGSRPTTHSMTSSASTGSRLASRGSTCCLQARPRWVTAAA